MCLRRAPAARPASSLQPSSAMAAAMAGGTQSIGAGCFEVKGGFGMAEGAGDDRAARPKMLRAGGRDMPGPVDRTRHHANAQVHAKAGRTLTATVLSRECSCETEMEPGQVKREGRQADCGGIALGFVVCRRCPQHDGMRREGMVPHGRCKPFCSLGVSTTRIVNKAKNSGATLNADPPNRWKLPGDPAHAAPNRAPNRWKTQPNRPNREIRINKIFYFP